MSRTAGDTAAIGIGYIGTAAYWADQLTPIMTFIMVALSVAWMLWRMVDRVRYGPKRGNDE